MLDQYSDKPEYNYILTNHLFKIAEYDLMPIEMIETLKIINNNKDIEIKTIYDIGASVLHFAKEARKIFKDTEIIVFDAFKEAEILYKKYGYKYSICLLSDKSNKEVEFYKNPFFPGGNSYYKEIHHDKSIVPFFDDSNRHTEQTKTLNEIVQLNNYPLPDLIKIDVQGCELDILKGANKVLEHNKYLIIEIQHKQYNEGAPLFEETNKYILSIGYVLIKKICSSEFDADYLYMNSKYIIS